ncbi:tautomerase family protein [Quadrisphaera oryzae]|uniref:tautomerase family protein n=1 Tax=Quadrisphaera TaxID=317661 RepID=UPI0016455D8E|nr:tautomerase family protein [Quadrisphaera sp. RL12-1S]MBC3761996.1 tautomerase family protein [Quadrisphaera sp. RL12-1S]
MPLLAVDVVRGRSEQQLRELLDVVQSAVVDAFEVPETDRYQVLTQHEPFELVALDTGLGISRTAGLVVVRVTSRERTEEKKVELYQLLAQRLEERCGVRADDLVVTITENGAADWSFGGGQAQFLTGAL